MVVVDVGPATRNIMPWLGLWRNVDVLVKHQDRVAICYAEDAYSFEQWSRKEKK